MPGEGLEPSCPLWGHLILSQARMTNFATPAKLRVAWSHAAQNVIGKHAPSVMQVVFAIPVEWGGHR
jgi:hypothetical protein